MCTLPSAHFLGPTGVLNPSGISISAAVFAWVTTVTDRPRDDTTQSVTVGCIYVRSTVMQPKNEYMKLMAVVSSC